MEVSVTYALPILNVMGEPDPRDAYSLPYDGADYLHGLDEGIEGLKIAYSATLGGHTVDPQIAALVSKAVDTLAGLGADVVEATPDLADTEAVFRIHWYSGAANLLQRFAAAAPATMEPGLQEVDGKGTRQTTI